MPALLALGLWLLPRAASAGQFQQADLQARFPAPLIVGERDPRLPVWPIFQQFNGNLDLFAHAFETQDLESVAGYGGKPINLLVLLNPKGEILHVELVSHAEPLFKSPAGTVRLSEFAKQYEGLTLQHDIQILGPTATRSQSEATANLHGVMAGTVSITAIDRAVLESAAQVAMALAGGGTARAAPSGPNDMYRRSGWNALVDQGLLQHWTIDNRKVQAAFADGPGSFRDPGAMSWPDGKAVDFWVAFIGLPQVGRNLLDSAGWMQVRQAREAGQTLLMVLDGGRYPVAASAAPDDHRAALLSLQQDHRDFALLPFDYQGARRLSGTRSGVSRDAQMRLYAVQPAADGSRLNIEQPLTLALDLRRGNGADSTVAHAPASRPFAIPNAERFRPVTETPAWMAAWSKRRADLMILAVGLLVLTVALARQTWLSARPGRLNRFRIAWMLFTVGFIGWWAQGQLTVVTLTSAVDAAADGRPLDFLLADPVAVLLWGFTGVTLMVWGRGTFCGWLCPFGALQELLSQLAGLLGFKPRRLRREVDQSLKWLKYAVLAVLLAGAAATATWVDTAAEVEPFKTAISAIFNREWYYVLWAVLSLIASVIVYRSFCRYLCPLGAALAIVGRLRRWGWIARRAECGTPCQTCRHRCAYQAITPAGDVQYDECFQCLDCVAVYNNPKHCLPLVLAGKPMRSIPITPASPAHGAHA